MRKLSVVHGMREVVTGGRTAGGKRMNQMLINVATRKFAAIGSVA